MYIQDDKILEQPHQAEKEKGKWQGWGNDAYQLANRRKMWSPPVWLMQSNDTRQLASSWQKTWPPPNK
jgi:hypothetical protein